jgi:hypothetical protein
MARAHHFSRVLNEQSSHIWGDLGALSRDVLLFNNPGVNKNHNIE